jgi:hypothetical protein
MMRLAAACARITTLMLLCTVAIADDSAKQTKPSSDAQAEEAARAADFLQSVAESLRGEREGREDKTLRPRPRPILKYSDPARGYPASGVWRLGEAGRPKALVTLEYWLRAETDEPRLMFEFVSFTTDKFELKAEKDGTTFRADGSAPEFAELPGGPKPAASDKQRLIQLRALARRFAASEKHMGEFSSLRLLPQPIDRYEDAEHGIADGAAFVFAYGTNPELALLIECNGDKWRYAVARMSWSESILKLDDKEVASFPQLTAFPTRGAYQTAGHVVRLPKTAEDKP